MITNRDQETDLSVLAFLVQRPIDFAGKKDQLRHLRFTSEKVRKVYEWLVDQHDKHGEFPKENEMRELVQRKCALGPNGYDISLQEYELIVENAFHKETTGTSGDFIKDWLISQQLERLRDKFDEASQRPENVYRLIEDTKTEMKIITKANFNEEGPGMDAFSLAGIKQIMSHIVAYDNEACIPTGYPTFDHFLKGGLRKGEGTIFVGSTGIGKTFTLMNISRNALLQGAKVLYIYLDSTDEEISKRWAEGWFGAEIDASTDMERLAERYAKFRAKYEGKIVFKGFPQKSIDMGDLSEYIENVISYYAVVRRSMGWPENELRDWDLLALDYMGQMSFSNIGTHGGAAFEINEERSQEFIGVLKRFHLAGATAHQGGTESMKKDDPQLWDALGYKSIFNPFANAIMLGCSIEERKKQTRSIHMEFAKARRPGAVGARVYFTMNTLNQRLDEDPDRAPTTETPRENAPRQDAFQTTGEVKKALDGQSLISMLTI